ncbi:ABC transporter permease [Marinoscillum sp.]|uniref:ABC transporter permease n=1 Tax=Marinoscillum sp. TaxID=2024838 RepID=UPI003BAB1D70
MMKIRPPKYAHRFLRWFCKPDFLEEIEGDLIQLFDQRYTSNPAKARRLFWWDVIRSFRWVNLEPLGAINWVLYRNYVKTGYRRLLVDRQFSFISILGLSLGLVVFSIMTLYLIHELSFDKFHEKSDRTYEVIQLFENPDGPDPEIFTSFNLSKALREEVSFVETAVTIHGAASTWFEVNGERYFEEEGIVAGKEFFQVFDFKLSAGDTKNPLALKRSIVLDENLASKYFGEEDPIGKVLSIERYGLFTVRGIMEPVPANSTMQFDYIITQDYEVFFTMVAPRFPSFFQSWEGSATTTFVVLEDQSQAALFPRQAKQILRKHLDEQAINPHYLLSLERLHFGSVGIDGRVNNYVKGNKQQLLIFSIVAALILVMACANYVNLTTARSIHRGKEVGVRKVMGAQRSQLSVQFKVESLLIVICAFALALGVLPFLLPLVNELFEVKLQFTWGHLPLLVPLAVFIILAVTLLSGFYPALVMSRFRVIQAVKGLTPNPGAITLRKTLIVFQMMMAFGVLLVLNILNQQLNFITEKDLGFDSDDLMIVEINGSGIRNNYETIKTELLKRPEISNVTGLTRMISGYRSAASIYAQGLNDPEQQIAVRFYGMDKDGVNTLGLHLLAGADFTGSGQDSLSVILNESAAAYYGGNEIVGEWITLQEDDLAFRTRVVGVVEDFHYSSMHDTIGPVVMGHYKNPFEGLDDIVIRLNSENQPETIAYVERIHNEFDENGVMTWEMLDDMKMREYKSELKTNRMIKISSLFAVVIALAGVVGLMIYSVNARVKEFGIRRVLGARYLDILNILARIIMPQVGVALILVVPIVWGVMNNWLYQFAYSITPDMFNLTLVVASVFFVIVSVLSIVARIVIKKDPANSLRYE